MDVADTISYYERAGRHYSTLIGPEPDEFRAQALQRMVTHVPSGGRVLEIGSGPGRDADYLESLGVQVDRTDAARSFVEIQAERGKDVSLLNIVADELAGPYEGVLALCVLMHVGREDIDDVLGKIASSLAPGCPFLVSVREGEGIAPPPAAMLFWRRDDFAERLEDAGLEIVWDELEVDCADEAWLTFLARRPSA